MYLSALGSGFVSLGVSPRALEAIPPLVYALQQKMQSSWRTVLYRERLADGCLHPWLANNLETVILIPVTPSILSRAAPPTSHSDDSLCMSRIGIELVSGHRLLQGSTFAQNLLCFPGHAGDGVLQGATLPPKTAA